MDDAFFAGDIFGFRKYYTEKKKEKKFSKCT